MPKPKKDELIEFIKTYLIPVVKYTANKKEYLQNLEREFYTGQTEEDYNDWAESRAKLAMTMLEERGLL